MLFWTFLDAFLHRGHRKASRGVPPPGSHPHTREDT